RRAESQLDWPKRVPQNADYHRRRYGPSFGVTVRSRIEAAMAFIKILSLVTALVLSAGPGIADTSDGISVVTPILKTSDVVDTTVSTTEIRGIADIDGSYLFNAEQ